MIPPTNHYQEEPIIPQLFSKTTLGSLTLQNHLVMAPMTRNRATNNIPNDLIAQNYAQRATAGLIITEGTRHRPTGWVIRAYPGYFPLLRLRGGNALRMQFKLEAQSSSCSSCTVGASPILLTCRLARALSLRLLWRRPVICTPMPGV